MTSAPTLGIDAPLRRVDTTASHCGYPGSTEVPLKPRRLSSAWSSDSHPPVQPPMRWSAPVSGWQESFRLQEPLAPNGRGVRTSLTKWLHTATLTGLVQVGYLILQALYDMLLADTRKRVDEPGWLRGWPTDLALHPAGPAAPSKALAQPAAAWVTQGLTRDLCPTALLRPTLVMWVSGMLLVFGTCGAGS